MLRLATVGGLCLGGLGVAVAGCGSESAAESADGAGVAGSRQVTQGGARDIARFRSIVAAGGIPAPEVLDEVGFFAEHAVDLPAADCGEDVCVHPFLAVAPRFNGDNWTMAFVAMNSPLDPATLPRPPLHVVLAVELSDRLETLYPWIKSGIRTLAAELRDGDRISVVWMGPRPVTVLDGVAFDPAALDGALFEERSLERDTRVDLYGGLRVAAELAERDLPEGEAARIVLLTSGHASAGIQAPERIVGLASAIAAKGIGVSVLGAGSDYRAEVGEAIGQLGTGTYAYAESHTDLSLILRNEGQTVLFPIATRFSLTIEPSAGYRVGRVYGAHTAQANADRAVLASPALFLGHRTGADDVEGGRRGGGGGLFVELIADKASGVAGGAPAFAMRAEWETSDGRHVVDERQLINPLAPGQNPADMWPELSDPEQSKAFMMLNMYLALRASTELFDAGDCAHAMGVLDMFAPAVEVWQARYDDPDIAADFELMLDLHDNLRGICSQGGRTVQPREPRNFHGGCFGL
jgi:Ca-activated chloride channel family protein